MREGWRVRGFRIVSEIPPASSLQVGEICRLVALRSAHMVALALSAILEHTGWTLSPRPLTIAFDGGMYEQFKSYRAMLRDCLKAELGE